MSDINKIQFLISSLLSIFTEHLRVSRAGCRLDMELKKGNYSYIQLETLMSRIAIYDIVTPNVALLDPNIERLILRLRKSKVDVFLGYTRKKNNNTEIQMVDPADLTRTIIVGNSSYEISGKALTDIKRFIRKLNSKGIFVSLANTFSSDKYFTWIKILDSKIPTKAGRPNEDQKQLPFLTLKSLLHELYIKHYWEIGFIYKRATIDSIIDNVLEDWLEMNDLHYGNSDSSNKARLNKLKLLCRQKVQLTLGTPHIGLEVDNCLQDRSLSLHVLSKPNFIDREPVYISIIRSKILKDVMRNGTFKVGTYEWYSVIPYKKNCIKWAFRDQLDQAENEYANTLEDCLYFDYSQDSAEREAIKAFKNKLFFLN